VAIDLHFLLGCVVALMLGSVMALTLDQVCASTPTLVQMRTCTLCQINFSTSSHHCLGFERLQQPSVLAALGFYCSQLLCQS
jgi:hypothetical protein